jgi:hypothetical protein
MALRQDTGSAVGGFDVGSALSMLEAATDSELLSMRSHTVSASCPFLLEREAIAHIVIEVPTRKFSSRADSGEGMGDEANKL